MNQARETGSSKQTRATFLRNHAQEIWAYDFSHTYDLFFRSVFAVVIIELGSRRLAHFGVTRNPTDAWVAQHLRNATPFGQGPRFLIHDNDRKYGASFARVAKETGIEVLWTPYGAPKANDYASYCISFALSSTTSANRRRPANGRPWLLRGASAPGGSNR